jgi:L,D-transpeptidase YcbB
MTQAYFEYATNLSSGLLNPADLDVIWEIKPDKIDLVNHLENAIESRSVAESFEQLKPQHKQYDLLLNAFHQLINESSNGGWPVPGFFPTLRESDTDENVIRLKKYLIATGDLQTNDSAYVYFPEYDQNLSFAVKRFQERHGLEQDGIAGENTLKQMNISLEYRLEQIRLNLDRIRWLPDDFGKNHIVINIPDYSFEYLENGQLVQEMKVVVGRNENYTPVLEDTLSYIIFNPTWNIPNSIATNEIFPKMLEDITYMERNNYSVLRTSYVSKDTIDVKNYDWSEISHDRFPYFIVQHPGPLNSLGQIQFMLGNQYSIFLHDTPANHLFNVAQRDFSHGCIRLEKPEELALTLLRDKLPADTIMKYITDEEKRAVYLDEKVPVHIVYFTAWVEEDGMLHFRDDVYEFDKLSMAHFRKVFPEFARFKP